MVDTSKMVFVFGSNTGGIHGAGAARYAYHKRGAIWGCGFGHTSQETGSGSFAIPTKGIKQIHNPHGRNTTSIVVGDTLSLPIIGSFVDTFITYTIHRSDLNFQITCIGCGLAGLKHEDIAPMFRDAPVSNCYFDLLWEPILGSGKKYWGTFS